MKPGLFGMPEQLQINNDIFEIKNKMNMVETCESLKYLLKGCIKTIFGIKENDFDYELQFYNEYTKQYNDYKDLQNKVKEYEDYVYTDEEINLLKKYSKLFRYINKLLKEYKYELKEVKKSLNNDIYKELKKMHKVCKKNQNDLLNANINSKRELNKLVCYDIDENENMIPKSHKQISLFTSYLTDVLGLEEDKLTTDLVIVKVYHYSVLDSLINNNFTFLGKEFIAFGASAGQTRTKKCVFISKEILDKFEKTITCGLTKGDINNSDEKGCNITKWLAYLTLVNGATDKWEEFDINSAVVLPDWETEVNGKVDFIETKKIIKTIQERVRLCDEELEIEEKKAYKNGKKPKKTKLVSVEKEILAITDRPKNLTMNVPIVHSDGCGWMLTEDKPFMFRLPWFKGLLINLNYNSYIDEYCNGNDEVIDIWGRTWHLKKDNIKYVFFKSQFKMYKYYSSWDEYKKAYIENNCHARKCNVEKDKFPDADLNYQMIQTLTKFKPEDVDYVTKNTVDYIVNAYSDIATMLDIMGCNKRNTSYFQQAMKIYPELLKDNDAFEELKSCISARKKDAKFGKIRIPGSKYTFISPDPVAWMNNVFKCDKNNDKILQKDECYCRLFRNSKNLAILRSPHLYREWAICDNTAYKKDTDLQKKYYNNYCVYTSSLSLISKTLMFDTDGDSALCISDSKWIELGKENMKGVLPLYYQMGKASAQEINNRNIYESIVQAYESGNIGKYSNLLTAAWNSDLNDNLDILKVICALNVVRHFNIGWKCKIISLANQ